MLGAAARLKSYEQILFQVSCILHPKFLPSRYMGMNEEEDAGLIIRLFCAGTLHV